jgi:hypothetical protein
MARLRAAVKIDDGIGGPDPLLQVLAGDYFKRTLDQSGEDLKRPGLQFELTALLQ